MKPTNFNGESTSFYFLEAQLLSNYIDVTDSLSHGTLSVDRFGRSLRFCNLEFDVEAIFDGFMAHFRVFRGSFEFEVF